MKKIMSCVIFLTLLSGCDKITEPLKLKDVIYIYPVQQANNAQTVSIYAAMIYEVITICNSFIGWNVYAHIIANKWIYVPATTLGVASYLAYEYLPLKRWYDETIKFFAQNVDKGNKRESVEKMMI
jgi:hypothetical protein